MQTIDIAQAIKDNSANVSQNLDPSVLGELLPTATFNNKGILSSSAYRNIPQKINIGKEYNAIRIADNLQKWVRQSIPFSGYIPLGKQLAFHGFAYFETSDIALRGGAKILSYGDNSEGLLELYSREENDKFHLYLVAPITGSSEIDTFFITSPYECVREKITLDDSFKKLQINII